MPLQRYTRHTLRAYDTRISRQRVSLSTLESSSFCRIAGDKTLLPGSVKHAEVKGG
jgi:hypothetical protein